MRIYTRRGDKGKTSLIGGQRVSKNDKRVEAYGSVDELNAALGVCIAEIGDRRVKKILTDIQHDLFRIGAELAAPARAQKVLKRKLPPKFVINLEKWIDAYDAKLTPLKQFILPGGTKAAAHLHLARTICRRVERRVTALTNVVKVNPVILEYLNRLSDLLFVLARTLNKSARRREITWQR